MLWLLNSGLFLKQNLKELLKLLLCQHIMNLAFYLPNKCNGVLTPP